MESYLCPRRTSAKSGESDHWQTVGADRVCSYCGSMHPDEFISWCEDAIKVDSKVSIDSTDKPYKVYIHRPGVSNASEGAIKFYLPHLTAGQRNGGDDGVFFLINAAARVSLARLMEQMNGHKSED